MFLGFLPNKWVTLFTFLTWFIPYAAGKAHRAIVERGEPDWKKRKRKAGE